MMWAHAVLQQQSTHVHSFVEAASMQLPHLTPEGRRQVFMFMLAAEDAGAVEPELRDGVPLYREVREACLEAWLAGQQALSSSSGVQQEVLQVLQSLPGCGHAALQHPTDDGLFRMDIALPSVGGGGGGISGSSSSSESGIAVEMDGPSHFLSPSSSATPFDGEVLDGSTAFRNRLLSARGWRVVSVPVEEWGRLPQGGCGDAAVGSGGEGGEAAVVGVSGAAGRPLIAQQRYLMEKLATVS